MITRGCGRRKPGNVYWMTEVGEYGTPWYMFLHDPVIPVDMREIGMTPVEILAYPAGDGRQCVDLWDFVGAGTSPHSQGYWNAADYIEEGLRHGFSTLIPKPVLKKHGKEITRESRLQKIHPHAYIRNAAEFWAERKCECPKHLPEHIIDGQIHSFTCSGMLWETIEGGSEPTNRFVARAFPAHIPSPEFIYTGYEPPVKPYYFPGLFLWLPLTKWEIIQDEDGTHEVALNLLKESGSDVPYEVVEE